MKRILILFTLGIISFHISTQALAQTPKFFETEKGHYLVFSNQSQEKANEIADKMNACLALFNKVMHFDLKELNSKLIVKIFNSKDGFDEYLEKLVSQSREDFVYIHYLDIEKSELVGYEKPEKDFNTSLVHQGFIQFLKAFIPKPPMWLQDGLASYFENADYNSNDKRFDIKSNSLWINALKNIIKDREKLINIKELILLSREDIVNISDVYYPECWGLVYFLINSDKKEYNRLLWDAINALQHPRSNNQTSAEYIKTKVFSWVFPSVNDKIFQNDFEKYILAQKTYYDIIQAGVDLYNSQEYDLAKDKFNEAIEANSEKYLPFYYLGLISYSKGEYDEAESKYNEALNLEKDTTSRSRIYYAMGVNAYVATHFEEAEEYLKDAKKLDPDYWSFKVDDLLRKIEVRNIR